MNRPIPNETRVTIKSPQSWANRQWGIVKGFDGENYHVAVYNGPEQLVFARSELIVRKPARKSGKRMTRDVRN